VDNNIYIFITTTQINLKRLKHRHQNVIKKWLIYYQIFTKV